MAERLTVTSSELRSTASDMRAGASTIAGELQRLMGRVRTLTSSWTGTAASAFDGYYEQFNTSWSQCEQALNGIADLLNASAGSYDDTEAGVAGQFRG
jgi:early secretory antigenic target protein ESAT-6